jgi:hypothetical protein
MRTGVPLNQDCSHWRSTARAAGRGAGGALGFGAAAGAGTLGVTVLQPCSTSNVTSAAAHRAIDGAGTL